MSDHTPPAHSREPDDDPLAQAHAPDAPAFPPGTKRRKAFRHITALLAIWLITSLLLALAAAQGLSREADLADPDDGSPPLRLNMRLEQLDTRQAEDGRIEVRIPRARPELWLPADQFIQRLHDRRNQPRSDDWLLILLNISGWTGVLWVSVGLTGQILFTGRMLIQWLVSEKARQSVIPTTFWWMSLTGATMLIIYFAWRRDIVGVLGQSTGWAIYLRNLYMIYRKPSRSPISR